MIYSGNTANNINVSSDGRTLTFDPIIQSQEGSYYCWTAISAQENVYSRLVPLTILRKSIIHFHIANIIIFIHNYVIT